MNRILGYALPTSLVLLVCACSGSSPTAPEQVGSLQVATPFGVAKVQFAVECSTSSEAEIRGEIAQGYRRAIRDAPEAESVSVEPLTIQVLAWRETGVWRYPPSDQVEYGCGDEGALEHEMGHRIAHYLGRYCSAEVWHTVDLNCNPL